MTERGTGSLTQLDLAERIEEIAARIYRALAKRHAGSPEARGLFEKLAAEEDQHALRVRMVRTRYLRDNQSVGDIALDVSAAMDAVRRAEELCDRVAAAPDMTFTEAKRLARQLEEDLSRTHAEMLADSSAPEVRAFLESLARQDLEHARVLSD